MPAVIAAPSLQQKRILRQHTATLFHAKQVTNNKTQKIPEIINPLTKPEGPSSSSPLLLPPKKTTPIINPKYNVNENAMTIPGHNTFLSITF
jgi:hypothetical protein